MMRLGRRLVLGLGWAVAGIAAEPPVEFSGVLVTDGRPKVALRDKETGTTRWLEPGGQFNGFALTSYHAKDEAVVLRKDGQDFRLTLVSSSRTTPAADGRAHPSAATVPAPAPVPVTPPASGSVPIPMAENAAAVPLPVGPPPAIDTPPAAPTMPAPNEALARAAGNPAQPTAPANPPPVAPEGPATAATSTPAAGSGAGEMTGPTATVITRTAQPGDSAASIARAAGLTLEQLRALNPSINPDSIQPGQPIRIR